MAGAQKENVAVFNPLVLALPNWHPDGPDGTIDGFVIPFVMPAPSAGLAPNRHARIKVQPDDEGRWAALLSNVYMGGAECMTANQARALAGAWIRAAELLEAQEARLRAEARAAAEDQVVDAEVVDDDDDYDYDVNNRRLCCPSDLSAPHTAECPFVPDPDDRPKSSSVFRADQLVRVIAGAEDGRRGRIVESRISAGNPIEYDVLLEPDQARMRGFDTIRFEADMLRAIVDGCPACGAGTCTLHGEASQ